MKNKFSILLTVWKTCLTTWIFFQNSIQRKSISFVFSKSNPLIITEENGEFTNQAYSFDQKNWVIEYQDTFTSCQLVLRYNVDSGPTLVYHDWPVQDKMHISIHDYLFWFSSKNRVQTNLLAEDLSLTPKQCLQLQNLKKGDLCDISEIGARVKEELGLDLMYENARKVPIRLTRYIFGNLAFSDLKECMKFKDQGSFENFKAMAKTMENSQIQTFEADKINQQFKPKFLEIVERIKKIMIDLCRTKNYNQSKSWRVFSKWLDYSVVLSVWESIKAFFGYEIPVEIQMLRNQCTSFLNNSEIDFEKITNHFFKIFLSYKDQITKKNSYFKVKLVSTLKKWFELGEIPPWFGYFVNNPNVTDINIKFSDLLNTILKDKFEKIKQIIRGIKHKKEIVNSVHQKLLGFKRDIILNILKENRLIEFFMEKKVNGNLKLDPDFVSCHKQIQGLFKEMEKYTDKIINLIFFESTGNLKNYIEWVVTQVIEFVYHSEMNYKLRFISISRELNIRYVYKLLYTMNYISTLNNLSIKSYVDAVSWLDDTVTLPLI